MENLLINKENKIMTIESREVAEMMGKEHKEILQYLEGRTNKNGEVLVTGIIPTLESEGLHSLNYFIESSYKAGTRSYKCYLVTKMGCELLAHKQTGTKGILFSAKYVERFNEMEKRLTQNLYSFQIEDPIERAKQFIKEQEQTRLLLTQKDEIIEELSPLAELARKRIDKTGTVSLTDVTKSFNLKKGQISVWAKTNGLIHKSITEVNKVGEEYFKVVCPDGEHKGIGITEKGLKFIDENIDEIKMCSCRMKKDTKN